ncbi:MAG TPA: histidine phosphatase family protein, partial [Burkholderiales bacterium]
MSAGRLLIVRHGQTGGNRQRYVGWEDEPLDGVGVEQAQAVAALLREVPIDALYSSTLSRAVDTARPLAEQCGLDIRLREELKEIDYGRYQGMLKNEQPFKLRREHQYDAMPGGESLF